MTELLQLGVWGCSDDSACDVSMCRAQDVDRYSPAWWYADVPETAIIPLRKLEAVLPYLRQVKNLRPCAVALSTSDTAHVSQLGRAKQCVLCKRQLHTLCGKGGSLHCICVCYLSDPMSQEAQARVSCCE